MPTVRSMQGIEGSRALPSLCSSAQRSQQPSHDEAGHERSRGIRLESECAESSTSNKLKSRGCNSYLLLCNKLLHNLAFKTLSIYYLGQES